MDTTEILDLLNQYSESEHNNSWFYDIPNCGRATGAFKECLIFPDMDFVLKMPFEFNRNSETWMYSPVCFATWHECPCY